MHIRVSFICVNRNSYLIFYLFSAFVANINHCHIITPFYTLISYSSSRTLVRSAMLTLFSAISSDSFMTAW